MIDKEKLLKRVETLKYDNRGYVTIFDIIKNFPEEPAIDFDALYEEHRKNCCIGDYCKDNSCNKCYTDFLKSKNLSAPKQREIPAKTIYTLKKEYQDVFKDFGFLHSTFDTHSYEPLPENIKKYYDRTDELDYSQIPNGSVIEFNYGIFRRFVSYQDGYITYNDGHDQAYEVKASKVIRVVEWAKEV